MAYKPYADSEDFCEACSPFQQGDVVTLLKNVKLDCGILEKGTVLIISDVELNGVKIPTVLRGEEYNYEIHENAFRYRAKLAIRHREELINSCDLTGVVFEPEILEKGSLSEAEIENAIKRKAKLNQPSFADILFFTLFAVGFVVIFSLSVYRLVNRGLDDVFLNVSETICAGFFWFVLIGIPASILLPYRFKKKGSVKNAKSSEHR